MRLTLTRSGGFAGLLLPPVSLDTAALPPSEAQRLESLIIAANCFDCPQPRLPRAPQPDRFQFSLMIVQDDGREQTLTFAEEEVSGPAGELIQYIWDSARR